MGTGGGRKVELQNPLVHLARQYVQARKLKSLCLKKKKQSNVCFTASVPAQKSVFFPGDLLRNEILVINKPKTM